MSLIKIIQFVFVVFLFISCDYESKKKGNFYTKFEDGDIYYIPIKEPYRVFSIDNGTTWYLEPDWLGDPHFYCNSPENIIEFAVSKNILFGQELKGWFLFDMRTGFLARFKTENMLHDFLQEFNIKITPSELSNDIYDELIERGTIYWLSNTIQSDTTYYSLIPKVYSVINIGMYADSTITLNTPDTINETENSIYFFQLSSDLNQLKDLNLSIDLIGPIPFDKEAYIPVYILADSIKLFLNQKKSKHDKNYDFKGLPINKVVRIKNTK